MMMRLKKLIESRLLYGILINIQIQMLNNKRKLRLHSKILVRPMLYYLMLKKEIGMIKEQILKKLKMVIVVMEVWIQMIYSECSLLEVEEWEAVVFPVDIVIVMVMVQVDSAFNSISNDDNDDDEDDE